MVLESLTNFISGSFDPLKVNYQLLQPNSQFGDGRLWSRINLHDQAYEQYYTGDAFQEESPKLSLVKTALLLVSGSWFFAGTTTYHLGRTAYELGLSGKDTYERFKLKKSEDPKASLKDFIRSQHADAYVKPLQALKQTGKSLMCWIPFAMMPLPHLLNPPTFLPLPMLFNPMSLMTDTNLGFYAGLGFVAYAIYDPRYPKVLLNQIERWIVTATPTSKPQQHDKGLSIEGEGEDKSAGNPAVSQPEESSPSLQTSFSERPLKSGETKVEYVKKIIQDIFEFNVPISEYLEWEAINLGKKKNE